ncbi:hypothetical protein JXL21_06665 [Candidatus Bathyarchaeota archaeon]|nr:hypothetical protein [Candidatus Bathyarchaeota archaeon]
MLDFQTLINIAAMISIPVGVAYHITTLYNTRRNQQLQLETRQAQLYMAVYNKFTTRENIDILMDLLEWEYTDYDDFQRKYGKENNPEGYSRWIFYINLMEALGPIVREGYLDIRMIALVMSGGIKAIWEKYEPVIMENRRRYNWPRWAIEFEGLYKALIEYAKKNPEIELQTDT